MIYSFILAVSLGWFSQQRCSRWGSWGIPSEKPSGSLSRSPEFSAKLHRKLHREKRAFYWLGLWLAPGETWWQRLGVGEGKGLKERSLYVRLSLPTSLHSLMADSYEERLQTKSVMWISHKPSVKCWEYPKALFKDYMRSWFPGVSCEKGSWGSSSEWYRQRNPGIESHMGNGSVPGSGVSVHGACDHHCGQDGERTADKALGYPWAIPGLFPQKLAWLWGGMALSWLYNSNSGHTHPHEPLPLPLEEEKSVVCWRHEWEVRSGWLEDTKNGQEMRRIRPERWSGVGEVLEYKSQMGEVTLLGNWCCLTIREQSSRVTRAQP